MEHVLDLCLRHGVPFGTSVKGHEAAARWIGKGALFFEEASELDLISRGAKAIVDGYRAITQSG